MKLTFLEITGAEIQNYIPDVAKLRLSVFREYPYLYEGTMEYESQYLKKYSSCPQSILVLCKDGDTIVGASTGVLLSQADLEFQKPFLENGMDLKNIFYFGESVLLPHYRGQGIGKEFMLRRQNFAYALPEVTLISFCAVIRDSSTPIPADYRSPEYLWKKVGFSLNAQLKTEYEWKDIGAHTETNKPMQFWTKKLCSKIKIIHRYYENFNQKNWDAFLELLDENIAHDISQGGREVGKTAFKNFLKVMDEHYDEKVVHLRVLNDFQKTHFSAEFEILGTYIKSATGLPPARGQHYRIPVGAFFEIKNKKITRISNHYNLKNWIDQVKQ